MRRGRPVQQRPLVLLVILPLLTKSLASASASASAATNDDVSTVLPATVAAIPSDRLRFDSVDAFREALEWDPEWTPNTPAWGEYMDRRMAQVTRIKNSQQRWDGYLVALQQGLFIQNYTAKGWAVVDCPPELYAELYRKFHEQFDDPTQRRHEGKVDQIHCPDPTFDEASSAAVAAGGGRGEVPTLDGLSMREAEQLGIVGAAHRPTGPEGAQKRQRVCDGAERPFFVNTGMNRKILEELKPFHEEWSGVPLVSSIAYGLRVYKNGSSLTMHTDRIDTHVISSILHVDRDYGGAEPWPIVIEGVDGVTAEVDLKPGQMLFYESAKCTHGRPRTFKGNWYTSLFIHYRPVDFSIPDAQARIQAVPNTWHTVLPPHPEIPELTVYGTGFKEHGCHNGWCNLRDDWPATEPMLTAGSGGGPAALFTTHVSNASLEQHPSRWSLAAAGGVASHVSLAAVDGADAATTATIAAAAAAAVGDDEPSASCRDDHEQCHFWATSGECDDNPNYMLTFCKKSCRVCSGGGSAGVGEL